MGHKDDPICLKEINLILMGYCDFVTNWGVSSNIGKKIFSMAEFTTIINVFNLIQFVNTLTATVIFRNLFGKANYDLIRMQTSIL